MKSKNKVPSILELTGRDEMNLAEVPFTLLSNRGGREIKSIETRDWFISGSDEYGLPLAMDEGVYIAMMKLSKDQGFRDRKVRFTKYRMIELMEWPDNGESYRRVIDALRRLKGVSIYSKKFWDNGSKQYKEVAFNLIDNYEIFEERTGRKSGVEGSVMPLSSFTWNEVLFESFRAGFIKALDAKRYFRLKLPTSRRGYRFLDKRLYQRTEYEIDLLEYAYEKIGLSRKCRYPSHIRQKLEPSFEELVTDGFLASVEYEEKEDSVLVIFRRPPKRRSQRLEGASLKQDKPSLTQDLINELVDRGLTRSVAGSLAKCYADRIPVKIEVFDWFLQAEKATLKNPVGFLRRSIEEDWEPPPGFVSKAERERRKREAEDKRAKREEEERWRQELMDRQAQEREKKAQASPWKELWGQVLEKIEQRVRGESYKMWFKTAFISEVTDEGVVVIDCNSEFAVNWMYEYYHRMVQEVLAEIKGEAMKVEFACSMEESLEEVEKAEA